jgi:hypothetical protein
MNPLKPTRKHARTLTSLALAGLLILLLTPLGAAQFGTQIKAGDYGHLPVTKGPSVALKILYADMGVGGDVRDDCVYIDTTSPATLNNGLNNKDLRLTKCGEKNPGTAITDADVWEKGATPAYTAVAVHYADVNSNAKYDKGDYVFITTNLVADTNLASTTSPTVWTIRLTVNGLSAGTFVFPGDADFSAYGSAAPAMINSLVERDDSVWFMISHAAAAAPYDVKGALVLADSIRINANALLQPAFKVLKLDMDSTNLPAGSSFTAKAEVQNSGKGSGMGIVISKVNGLIVDAQITPYMSPSEKVTMTVKGFLPLSGTMAAFEVGDQFKQITIVNGTAASGTSNEDLATRLAALEAEIALLKAAEGTTTGDATGSIKAKQADAVSESPSPSFVWLVALIGVALLVRRRTA